MRQLGQVLAVTFAVGGALTHTSAEAVELESFWNHNHSTVALISHGNLLTFFYQAPRPSMRAAGVKEGTLLFSGTRTDDKCSGTAYVFSSRCGPVAYSVIGRIASDSRRITLSGMAPAAFDEECRATDYREDVLYFTFLKNTNDPAHVKEERAAFMRDAIESIEAENKRRVQKRKEKGAKNVFRYFFNLPTIEPFLDWDYYFLRHDLSWYPNPGDEVGDIEGVTVPGGFVSDLASVPRLFWVLLPRSGRYAWPAVVHDYLYWAQITNRATADKIFEIALKDLRVERWKVALLTASVRSPFGLWAWNENAARRKRGEKRLLKELPPENKPVGWHEWREKAGVFAE